MALGTPTCHDDRLGETSPTDPVVALVGAPNVGKSTLFNALTGARRTIGNWPGTTVETGRGVWRATGATGAGALTLLDLPGAYSLDATSPDEELTRDLLLGTRAGAPDAVVVVADAAHLSRSLYLVAQVRELPVRVVVALTMTDVAATRGIAVDTTALGEHLGCPVVVVDPRHRGGLMDLRSTVTAAVLQPPPQPRTPWSTHRRAEAPGSNDRPVRAPAAARGTAGAAAALVPGDPELEQADERFAFVQTAYEAAVAAAAQDRVAGTPGRAGAAPSPGAATWSDRVDRWVTAPWIGPLVFLGVMWLVFQVTTTVAAPLQDALDGFVSGPLTDGAHRLLGSLGLGGSWVDGLVTEGLLAGVGTLLTFAPLMALMFLLLALLESSGYMARAAVVTDRLMRSIGLPGRAFLPLVVGFGCNVPAISATRILPNARHRLLTALLVPFTSCTARLTVYVLIGTAFFGRYAGTLVFGMYVLSIALVVLVGLLLRSTLLRSIGDEPLVMDLPAYQLPTLRLTAAVTWTRLLGFLRTAGGIIVATVALIWLLQSVPVRGEGSFGETPVADSAYGVAAQTLTPALAPAGFGDWKTTSALVVGFVAKEAVISSWATSYGMEDATAVDDPHQPGDLGTRIRADFERSSGGHTVPAVLAFLTFLLAYTPCVATLAAQRREIGTRWTAVGVALQLTIAWTLAVLVFQVGKVLG